MHEKMNFGTLGELFLCEFHAGGMEGHKIQSLSQAGVIHTDHVEQAMLKVDRSNYAPRNAYTDAPQPLGHQAGFGTGQVFLKELRGIQR